MTLSPLDLTRIFAPIGLLSFGGPAAQIGLLHRELVEKRRLIAQEEYLRALSFCMLLPGPEAMQLATWIGWRLGGLRGGLIAGGLFVLPGALAILALSLIYVSLDSVALVSASFIGLQAAVMALVIDALWKLSKRALITSELRLIAISSFLGLFFLGLGFPVIIFIAGLWGFLSARKDKTPLESQRKNVTPMAATFALWAFIWLAPLGLIAGFAPERFSQIGIFFAKLAAVSFGGAYALLAWMSQEIVSHNQWLSMEQMMDGLALAESTPGPLILVTQFVGFMAGFQLYGLWGGLFGAAIALWATFIPSFLFIFTGAPLIERLSHMPRLSEALRAITAAVVGVIGNLTLWFALHVLFGIINETSLGPFRLSYPQIDSIKPLSLLIAIGALYALVWRKYHLIAVLCFSALVAVTASLI